MSINYYNKNAQCFYNCTVDVDMSEHYMPFLALIPPGGHILDAGCGSGRDAKAFADLGYKVTAFDASEELVKMARELTGFPVKVRGFEDIDEAEEYDGIWACASLLHIPKQDLPGTFSKLATALKPGGVFYCSFKYGDSEWSKDGRLFTDLNEDRMTKLIEESNNGLRIRKIWVNDDLREERDDKWLNVTMNKNC